MKSLIEQKVYKEKKARIEYEKISEIIYKIECEFGIKILLLFQPTSLEEAKKLYKRLKSGNYQSIKYIENIAMKEEDYKEYESLIKDLDLDVKRIKGGEK